MGAMQEESRAPSGTAVTENSLCAEVKGEEQEKKGKAPGV